MTTHLREFTEKELTYLIILVYAAKHQIILKPISDEFSEKDKKEALDFINNLYRYLKMGEDYDQD